MTIVNSTMMTQMAEKPGFIAALDQSGGSTPGALRAYGIADDAWQDDEAMFRLMHEMRVRVISAPAFNGDKVIAAILFEKTMDGEAEGTPVPSYLWEQRGVVPFVKIDKGLQPEADGVSLMKPIDGLDTLLERAARLGVFGTKERSTIKLPSEAGIAAVVAQQFEVAAAVSRHGLVPILEPEVLIASPAKAEAESLLRDALRRGLDQLPADSRVMLKLTPPDEPDLYAPLVADERVVRVVALSGGYSREEACARVAANHGMIASFSRALLDDLRVSMSDTDFDGALAAAIDQIYDASVNKI